MIVCPLCLLWYNVFDVTIKGPTWGAIFQIAEEANYGGRDHQL